MVHLVLRSAFWMSGLFGLFALAGSVYVLILAVVGLVCRPRSSRNDPSVRPRTKFLILIPAHNEERSIAQTLESIRLLQYPAELKRIVVIADNCSDSTSTVVANGGFECWIRENRDLRGKGHALRWALDRETEFDAVVVIDADTCVRPDLLAALDSELKNGADIVQVRYDFSSDAATHVSTWTVLGKTAETDLFWRSRQQLGMAVFLQGNGFCITRRILQRLPWSAYSIVEDIQYSMAAISNGFRITFTEATNIVANSVKEVSAATPQRLRWASGTLQTILQSVPSVIAAGIRTRNLYILDAAIGAVLLSRMALVYLLGVSSVLLLVLPHTMSRPVAIVDLLTATVLCLYLICMSLCAVGGHRTWKSVLFLPGYLLWLTCVQGLASVGYRRNTWTRTPR